MKTQNGASITNKKFLPWIVCFSAALFFFYEFIQMNMFNAISADLMRAFSLHATELGKLSAYYFYANLLFLPIAGALLDRFSTRLIILSALLLCVIGITGFATTHSFVLACIFRFMSGIGSAFCFLSSIRLASRWFPSRQMALVSGLIVTMAMMGGMVAQTPLTLLAQSLGWRHTLLLDAGLGLFIFTIIFSFVQDCPPELKQEQKASQTELSDLGLVKSWRLAYLNPQNLLCGLYTSLTNLPIALLGAIWGSLFLQQTAHFSATEASLAPSLLFLGTIIGGPVMGWLSDRMRKRVRLMVMGTIISLLLTLIIICLPALLSLTTVLFLFFALGFFTSSQVLSYPLVAESNTKSLTATSVSVVSFFAIGGYAVFQSLFGWLMDYNWHGSLANQIRVYSVNDYHRALLILPIGFCIALLATFLMRDPNKAKLD
ncbi:transporter MFS superfamily [Candidatus Rickettsiella viridis]|uniref:Lysosomal dipeptide transporter MFSD1 n=1 Tax=Candidatus Rickettsiella viridis TaxID=676208 RepID=A0A2Z5V7Z8_9COXI|nr:MFS transporter [Candidatus Rickettsiella viridis]BBB15887.1 transporter MFS superfamily [Candidatus Rickettsiella viridis]